MSAADDPTLELLWESGDPAGVLRSRFGFDSADEVVRWSSSVLDEHWGLQVAACRRVVLSDTNALAWVTTSSGPLVVKWSVASERSTRLVALTRLTAWLARRGVPVSVPVPTVTGELHLETDGVVLSVHREIAGDLLDAGRPDQVHAAGAVLARLHDALAAYPEAGRFPAPPAGTEPLAARITRWLDSAPAPRWQVACDALRRLVAAAPTDALPVQLVHGDFRSANVLCAGPEVAAVLDLEEMRFDHRIVELGRSAVLLGTRFHDWAPVPPEVHAQLLDGYRSVRSLTAVEEAWWPVVVLWCSAVMVPPGDDATGWGPAAVALARELEAGGPPRGVRTPG